MPMRLRLQGAEVDLDQGTCSQVGDGRSFAALLTRRSMLEGRTAAAMPHRAAATSVTNVPLSCSTSQPRSIARSRPALYSSGVPFSRNRNGPLISSM